MPFPTSGSRHATQLTVLTHSYEGYLLIAETTTPRKQQPCGPYADAHAIWTFPSRWRVLALSAVTVTSSMMNIDSYLGRDLFDRLRRPIPSRREQRQSSFSSAMMPMPSDAGETRSRSGPTMCLSGSCRNRECLPRRYRPYLSALASDVTLAVTSRIPST